MDNKAKTLGEAIAEDREQDLRCNTYIAGLNDRELVRQYRAACAAHEDYIAERVEQYDTYDPRPSREMCHMLSAILARLES